MHRRGLVSALVLLVTLGAAPYADSRFRGAFRHNAFFIGPNVRPAVAAEDAVAGEEEAAPEEGREAVPTERQRSLALRGRTAQPKQRSRSNAGQRMAQISCGRSVDSWQACRLHHQIVDQQADAVHLHSADFQYLHRTAVSCHLIGELAYCQPAFGSIDEERDDVAAHAQREVGCHRRRRVLHTTRILDPRPAGIEDLRRLRSQEAAVFVRDFDLRIDTEFVRVDDVRARRRRQRRRA